MRNDERINASVKRANSLGYGIFWYGIFGVLLYRWFVLDLSLLQTIDLFAVWVVASLGQFISLASRGIPITYPVSVTNKAKRYYIFLVPLIAGFLSVLILFIFRDVTEVKRLVGGFLLSAFATFILFTLYSIIVYYWEKKNT